jgi:hypothetical protein
MDTDARGEAALGSRVSGYNRNWHRQDVGGVAERQARVLSVGEHHYALMSLPNLSM